MHLVLFGVDLSGFLAALSIVNVVSLEFLFGIVLYLMIQNTKKPNVDYC